MEEQKKEKKKFSLVNVLIGVLLSLLLVFVLLSAITSRCHDPELARRVICGTNLKNLSTAYLSYKYDNQSYPALEKWCDFAKQYVQEVESCFVCLADKTGPCSYAMNENIPADANDLPDDLVLLFESAPGWNQTGGADDAVTDRHGENKPGANIAFADGHVEFVKPEDIPNLRWTLESENQ
jgi:prepilin-type processing-associated H-X9-DG protein